jgi:hypothetical protein
MSKKTTLFFFILDTQKIKYKNKGSLLLLFSKGNKA